jgi:excisionase family DNA binding protein
VDDEILITIPEAARRLSIARSHLYQHLKRGTIASVHIGRSRRILVKDLNIFIEDLREDPRGVEQSESARRYR